MRPPLRTAPDELRQMVRCVQLYYRAQRHHNEIARELGLSSSKVSRLLKRAVAEGMVRVEIELPGLDQQCDCGHRDYFGDATKAVHGLRRRKDLGGHVRIARRPAPDELSVDGH